MPSISQSKWIKSLRRVLTILLLVYLGLALFAFLVQRKMLFHPSTAPLAFQRERASAGGFEEWTNSTGEIIGWKQTTSRSPHSRLLIVHGNSGSAINRLDYARSLQDAGAWDVYVMEYPGYGARAGSPSQQSFFAAADEVIALLKNDGPIYIMGESIGTGVACYLAGTYPDTVRGLLLIAPYHRMAPVAQTHMRMFPVGLMLLDKFPSEEYLKKYHGPVAVLVAGRDEVVPKRFGLKLFEDYQGRKKMWEIPEAGHNDLLDHPAEWWRELVDFWNTN